MKTPQFEKPTKSEWEKKAAADLRTDDLDSLIKWEPFRGVSARAYYDSTDRVHDSFTSFFSQLEKNTWQLLQNVSIEEDLKASNRTALSALNEGATGIIFNSTAAINNPESLFKDILPEHCLIAFKGDSADVLGNEFVRYFDNQAVQGIVIDGKKNQSDNEKFKSLGISVTSKHDIVPQLVQYLQELDKYRHVFGDGFMKFLNISINLDQKFYQSIALLKAIRWLSNIYAQSENLEFKAEHLHLNVTIDISGDYKKDLLINTSSGIAAVAGGADSISFNLKSNKGKQFNERIARNIGNLMRDEAKLNLTTDPTTGAYFLDYLTNTISELSWNQYTSLS